MENDGAGKGDSQRPRQIGDEEWAENWNRAFRSTEEESCSGLRQTPIPMKTMAPIPSGSIDIARNCLGSVSPALEYEIKTRSNAGIECDMVSGPCACGAWH